MNATCAAEINSVVEMVGRVILPILSADVRVEGRPSIGTTLLAVDEDSYLAIGAIGPVRKDFNMPPAPFELSHGHQVNLGYGGAIMLSRGLLKA